MKIDDIQEWLLHLMKGLVSFPDAVEISKISDEMGVLFIVKVDKTDQGKVIGREGSIAGATRVVLRSVGRLNDLRVSLKIDVGTNYEPRKELR